MRKCAFFCILLFAGCLLSAPAFADISDTIRTRYAGLKTFQASFSQFLTHRETGKTEQRKGQMLFKKPFLIRWETASPTPETLIVTDKEIWDYLPDEKLAYRYPRDLVEDSRTLIQIITGQALLSKDFEIEEKGKEGNLQILQLFPKEPLPQLVEATLYVDPERGYIMRAVCKDFYGNINDVRFTSFTPDADVSSRSFSFSAPSGVEVEDRVKQQKGPAERNLFN